MANEKIADLTLLATASVDAANDVLPIVDLSADVTKKVTPAGLVQGGGGLLKDGTVAMTGALDLGGQNITNPASVVGDLTVTGVLRGRPQIASEIGTSFAVDDTRHGQSIYAANASTITVTVNSGAVGGQVKITQDGAGQVQLSAGTGVTLHYAALFLPNTAQENSPLFLEWRTATDVYVTGDMAAA